MFEVLYKCTLCNRIYTKKPRKCSCTYKQLAGTIIKWAKLLEDKKSLYVKVQCLICGKEVQVNFYNITKQKSCGCLPRSINIINITETEIKYECKKCGDIYISPLPTIVRCNCEKYSEESRR